MEEQFSNVSTQPLVSQALPVKLWTPGFIAGVSFLLGFPAGIVLASINWMRMKMNNKAIIHLVAGAVGIFVFVIVLFLTPSNAGRALGIVVNLGVLFYLQHQMKNDIESFETGNNVEKAGGLSGCLIGLGVLLLFLLFAFGLAMAFLFLGVPIAD